MFKIIFFVPLNEAEKVKSLIFKVGAGELGAYSHCSFETKGIGQFLPKEGSNPYLGKKGEIERVEELKVEILCPKSLLKEAIKALISGHPYEVPAYEVVELFDLESLN